MIAASVTLVLALSKEAQQRQHDPIWAMIGESPGEG
jgi:hypothetical protein